MTKSHPSTRRPKKARTTRARQKPRLELTARDHDVLIFTGLCGYVSTEQIAREFFPSADRARRRIRRLYDGGYLSTIIWDVNESNLLRLSQRGWRYITAQQPEMKARLRRPGQIRAEYIPEHLCLVDARLYAAAFGRYYNIPLLRWGSMDSTVYRERELNAYGVRPESVAEFLVDDHPTYIAVALLAPHRRFGTRFRQQLAGYAVARAERALHALWLITGDDDKRGELDTLTTALHEAGLDGFAHPLTRADIVARPIQQKEVSDQGRPYGSNPPEHDASDSVGNSDRYIVVVRHE